ncbi:MAG: extracellular solute-binding protein [Hungatella sp.]|jgi:multiple sugar transport system substrate-binding protein|nr:extracellular solute-binding protein [Hungatella sp.]
MKLKSALKRGTALSLAATMVLSTAGCGKSDNTKGSTDSKAAAETTQKSDSDKPFDGVTVKWALTDNAATSTETKEMIALIKEKTGINVEFFITPTSKAGEMDKVLVSLMAGEDMDIIGRTPLQLEEFYKAAVLEPIDELAKADNYDMDTLYGGQTVKFEDQTYAIPAEKDIWLTYYNKKIFDEANIPYPTAEGWTWEKYVETAKKLNNPDKNVWGSFMSDDVACNYMQATQKGASAYKADGTANFDDPAYADAMKWFFSLGNELKIQPNCLDLASGTYPYNSFMVNGNIGMYVYGGWVASALSDKVKYPRDWELGILPMPYPEGSDPSSLTITSCYAIPKTSKNKEAAFEAIKTICENKYTLGYGRVPAKILTEDEAKAYIESSLLPKFKDDNLTVEDFMAGWFDNSRAYLSEKIMGTADTTIGQIYTEEGQLYGQGQKSLEDTMKSIQDRANEAIKEAQ